PDGGFPLTPGGESNAQSTAFAIQGLLAAHRDPGRLPHGSALGYLRSLAGRGGSVRYSPRSTQTPVWVTAQALAALAGRPLPIRPGVRAARLPAAGGTPASPVGVTVPARPRSTRAAVPARPMPVSNHR
ncbi:MAG: energy-coupling factor transport system substrate-specific component, partial [Solirubrobacteraceae bacterium]|nr:energy-coupling factor transport system substrate-specific component [Solirubrobacteraceae bacterium]